MGDDGFTDIEMYAQDALTLPAFPLNLREIRDNVKAVLGEVQRYGFFDEFTNHSFDHVLGMLKTAEWLIPKNTKKLLTPADWLFLTLSIYFHDVGLLISRDEFDQRSTNPEYSKYVQDLPASRENTAEFIARLQELSDDAAQRILYQDFVRYNHGNRVRAWIEGTALDDNGATSTIRSSIQKLLGKLDATAKKDLALLCDSHTIADIEDVTKYRVSKPYGDSAKEAVNLQYVAAILRTTDLLQITQKRAPSILFQIINPKDPVSQIEWQKQGAVRSVRPAPGKDREGRASSEVPSNTIEVHARFEKSEGFFGLTSYLAYAKNELAYCFNAVRKSESLLPAPPEFPWRYIDETGVEAEGFLTQAFGFELDQHKILDLLTGHTLYNDTDVVLRELTQNALDAVRLQAKISNSSPERTGRIDIIWNSTDRTLDVVDNGTGMSQAIIENHLLKVGSSRYQDPKFQEEHPDFSSISRFGIGVLSAFMVADNVEITTCSLDDPKARNISLRSVHGKYLIKLLDKVADRQEIGVYPHGTRVRSVLRSTAQIGDVADIAKRWLMFPRCPVYVKVNGADPVRVGYGSPKEAIESQINDAAFYSRIGKDSITVREVVEGGTTLAYAVAKDALFNDWSFVRVQDQRLSGLSETDRPLVATCVEGVGVEFSTPGFVTPTILAIANAVGRGAPKTNVARSALEDTNELRDMIKSIYRLYAKHVTDEVLRLSENAAYSLSRAVEQAPYIAAPLLSDRASVTFESFLDEALTEVPMVITEQNGQRRNVSVRCLSELAEFWTVESPLISSVEIFVREAPKNISASEILGRLQDKASGLPGETTVCNLQASSYVESAIKRLFEPCEIAADERSRRINLKWSKVSQERRWVSSLDLYRDCVARNRGFWSAFESKDRDYRFSHVDAPRSTIIPLKVMPVSGLESAGAFIVNREMYLKPADPLVNFLLEETRQASDHEWYERLYAYTHIVEKARYYGLSYDVMTAERLERLMDVNDLKPLRPYINEGRLLDAFRAGNPKVFDPFAWKRRDVETS